MAGDKSLTPSQFHGTGLENAEHLNHHCHSHKIDWENSLDNEPHGHCHDAYSTCLSGHVQGRRELNILHSPFVERDKLRRLVSLL